VRTNIMIDDALMAEAMRAAGLSSKSDVVELGLITLVRLRNQEDIRKLRGKMAWTTDPVEPVDVQ